MELEQKNKYKLSFWIEWDGTCLWAKNDKARERFGYAVDNNDLPVSKNLINELDMLGKEYQTALDWNYPPDPSPWIKEQALDFKMRADKAYLRLINELGVEYEVKYELTIPYGREKL